MVLCCSLLVGSLLPLFLEKGLKTKRRIYIQMENRVPWFIVLIVANRMRRARSFASIVGRPSVL